MLEWGASMRQEHIIELLSSAIEGDGIISVVFKFFHIDWEYTLEELDLIINFGIKNGDLLIEDMHDENKHYDKIDWRLDNVYQEIVMVDIYKYMPLLFSKHPTVPDPYKQFITE
jgi:hypothetical protein